MEFEDPRDADDAVRECDGQEMDQERMQRIVDEKIADKEHFESKRATLKAKIKQKHDRIHEQYAVIR